MYGGSVRRIAGNSTSDIDISILAFFDKHGVFKALWAPNYLDMLFRKKL